jgi:hypothetical protein
MAQAPKTPPLQIDYVDRPDLTEIFADFVSRLHFDGQTLRIEFCTTRIDDQRPQGAVAGKRYPSCRLVLSAAAGVDLMNKMQQITAALVKAGVLKAEAQKPPEELS